MAAQSNQSQESTAARLARIEDEVQRISRQLEQHHIHLFGDGDQKKGAVVRAQEADKRCNEAFELVQSLTAALLGEVDGPNYTPGLLKVVQDHDKIITNVNRMLWLVVTALTGLIIAAGWNYIIN